MENHAKYGEFIYAHAGDKLWVDLLIASELNWSDQGATVRLETKFPEDGKATLTFTLQQPKKLSIAVRCPDWLKPGAMKVAVNGASEKVEAKPGSYATVERTWKTGDKLEVEWPLALRTEMLPGSKVWVAVLWGPIVLAGEMGTQGLERVNFHGRNYTANRTLPIEMFPVFVGTTNDVVAKIKPVAGKRMEFRSEGLASPSDVTLAPFYTVHGQRYSVYWRLAERGGEAGVLGPAPTIASTSKASSPRTNYQFIVNAINDQHEPKSSGDRGKRHFDWWPVKGTNQWVQYDFAKPARVSAVEVYWFDDTGVGECRLPKSWQVLWRDKGEWKPVTHPSGYGCEGNRYNRTTFDAVETDGLRLDVLLPERFSSGLLQWKVE
jgi:hypothetical protein